MPNSIQLSFWLLRSDIQYPMTIGSGTLSVISADNGVSSVCGVRAGAQTPLRQMIVGQQRVACVCFIRPNVNATTHVRSSSCQPSDDEMHIFQQKNTRWEPTESTFEGRLPPITTSQLPDSRARSSMVFRSYARPYRANVLTARGYEIGFNERKKKVALHGHTSPHTSLHQSSNAYKCGTLADTIIYETIRMKITILTYKYDFCFDGFPVITESRVRIGSRRWLSHTIVLVGSPTTI